MAFIHLTQPAFWRSRNGPKPFYWPGLWIMSLLYVFCTRVCARLSHKKKLAGKSICVGNAIVGGAGKTPTLIALAQLLGPDKIVFMTRGYGGRMRGPILVEPTHTHADVGDEALILARYAPVIVARDRHLGAVLAQSIYPNRVMLLDDGLQNLHFCASVNMLVWDTYGDGNGHVLPAGPLRLPLTDTVALCDVAVTIDTHDTPLTLNFSAQSLITPSIQPQKIVAFAGIGRPAKFRASLEKAGFFVADFFPFPDHHIYSSEDLEPLAAQGLPILTTEKDAVRVPYVCREKILTVPYRIEFDDPEALKLWLAERLRDA